MPIKKGTADLGDLKKGNADVSAVYKGTQLVWSREELVFSDPFPINSIANWNSGIAATASLNSGSVIVTALSGGLGGPALLTQGSAIAITAGQFRLEVQGTTAAGGGFNSLVKVGDNPGQAQYLDVVVGPGDWVQSHVWNFTANATELHINIGHVRSGGTNQSGFTNVFLYRTGDL